MNISHTRILLLAGLVAGLSSCHDTSMSADTNFGPENVLQAPLLNKEENHQFDKTNSKLYDEALAENMFHSKEADKADASSTPDTSAHTQMDAAHGTTASAAADSLNAEHPAEGGHAVEHHAH